jgi:sodium transport system ATP-binding protein
MIEVVEVKKRFGEVVAVDGVSFTAKDGTITALLGPNGAGKTTTLRMMTCALAPDHGSIAIDGIDTRKDPLGSRARLGLFSDNRGLYPRLTSRENVRYYGELHGLEPSALERRIETLFDMLDMKSIADRRVDGFSLGQRMKVAIARTLVHDPPNVLLDEPTAGLDVLATRALRDVVRRLREHGKCVILSTHVMQEVSAIADRVVVMAKGQVRADATCDELLERSKAASLEDAFLATIGTAEGVEL